VTQDPARPVIRWGEQTALAVKNFPISGEPMPVEVVHAIVAIKSAAATVNERHGVVESPVAAAIRQAAEEVLAGEMSDQFPVDVFQTGSGTSTNMNVNEVLANRASELAGRPVHPNDEVNASQSSNDVLPTAVRLVAATALAGDVLPALETLRRALDDLAARHHSTVKMGRTHLMDAAPLTFGQEVGGWARMVHLGMQRVRDVQPRLHELPLGGTAVGTGLNAPPGFGAEVAALLAERTGLPLVEASDHFEAQSAHDALLDVTSACRAVALSLHKIAGDLRLLGSGPRGGLAEVQLPALQPGSSIMPGKVNPVIPEVVQQVAAQLVGNDATVAFAATAGTLQLSTAIPVIARSVVSSVHLLAAAATVLAEKVVVGLTVDAERMRDLAERSAAVTTVLVPAIGYDAAARVAHRMTDDGLSLNEALVAEGHDPAAVDVLRMTGDPGTG
jgi:fumarate hydratase class II